MKTKLDIKQFISKFETNGISYLDKINNLDLLEQAYKKLNKAYYNEEPLINDSLFDILKDYIEEKYPESDVLQMIGCFPDKCKANLPFYMPSMNKIKGHNNNNQENLSEPLSASDMGSNLNKELQKWKETYEGPYVISSKLDGVSGLYTFDLETFEEHLYTRGNVNVGSNISHLLKYININKLKNSLTLYANENKKQAQINSKLNNKINITTILNINIF